MLFDVSFNVLLGFQGSGTFWRRRFGAAVLATPFWRRTLWHRGRAPDTLAPRKGAGHFGDEEGYKPTQNGTVFNS